MTHPPETAAGVRSDLTFSGVAKEVERIVKQTPVFDVHTHQFPPSFRSLFSAGIDDLVTYHYLIAELFRSSATSIDSFWNLTKSQQADLIWETLFVRNTPISEACRGVVCVLTSFGLDPHAHDLKVARDFFASSSPHDHITRVMKMSGVRDLVMTNDVFDDEEVSYWESGAAQYPKFHAALRMDPLLNDWNRACRVLNSRGYVANQNVDEATISSLRSFLDDWIGRMKPLYMAVSLPPSFRYPEESIRAKLIKEVVVPTGREHNLPFSLMIGARKAAHPELRGAGDSIGHADIISVERICHENPGNRFLVSMLSRENQHELCVAARKFSNLMPFGCWWFLNNPSIVREITDERLELLGSSFIPQHSDARILDQLIYKWKHSRHVIAASLTEAYLALERDGWHVTTSQIERDVERMFQGNFRQVAGLSA